MTRPTPQRPDTTRLTIVALLAAAFVGAAFVLLPAPAESTVRDVRPRAPAAEPVVATRAPVETVPAAAEVFAAVAAPVADDAAPTF